MIRFNEYQKRSYLIIFFIFCCQIIFFSTIENFFLYKSVDDQFLQLKFYINNILIILVFFVFFFKSNKNQTNFVFPKFISNNKFLFYLTIIVLISSFFYLICKSIIIYHGYYAEDNPRSFFACFFLQVRGFYVQNLSVVPDGNFKLFYEIVSPISTIGINFLHGIVFFIIFFYKKLNKLNLLFSFIVVFFALLIYFLTTGSKNVILNFFIFSTSIFICKIILHKKIVILPYLVFAITSFAIVKGYYSSKIFCYKEISPILDEVSFIAVEYEGILADGTMDENKKKYYSNIDMLPLLKKNPNEIWKINNSNESSMMQEFLRYMLTGKHQGEYIYTNIDREFISNTVFQKTLHLILRDFKKPNIKMPLFEKYNKAPGGVSLLHMLWYDYWYFGIVFFIGLFVLLIKLLTQKLFSRYNLNYFIVIFTITIFFYNFLLIFNWYGLETMNSRFIFFDFLITLAMLFFINKKELSKTINNKISN